MNEKQSKIIENLLVAQAMVIDLPVHRFTENLNAYTNQEFRDKGPWHCGSAACFAGWVGIHPYFQEQGVKLNSIFLPEMGGKEWSPEIISKRLFGDSMMFEPGYFGEAENEKQVVLNRIKNALNDALDES